MSVREVKTSKLLSYVLRHRPDALGLTLDPAGWVDIALLLAALERRGHRLSRDELVELVRRSDKQRFAISEDGARIRANQGHSVPVDLGHPEAEPPEILYHGTTARFLDSIRAEGLRRGGRHHVHLSASREQASRVGARRGAPVVIEVLALAMARQGHVFYRAPNGVWLTEHVPCVFLRF